MLPGMKSAMIGALVLALLGLPGVATGQDDRGASVGGSVSATNMDSRTELSFAGAFGYRFSRVVGLDIETTLVPSLKSPFPGAPVQPLSTVSSVIIFPIVPTQAFANPSGRAVIFSNNVRVTIPTTAPRLEPYFVAGGGIASVRHAADVVYSYPPVPIPLAGAVAPALPTFPPISQHLTSSSVGLALTLGGGLGIRVAPQVWVDADLRLFRILGNVDQNVGRFGVGVRYRF
jgi:opacity protein-like surface antigen